MQWSVQKGYKPDAQAFQAALEGGHLQLAMWLLSNGCSRIKSLEATAENGHLHVLQWVQQNEGWVCEQPFASMWRQAYVGAARGNHEHILEWAVDQGLWEGSDVDLILEAGNMSLLKTRVAHGAELHPWMWNITLWHDDVEAGEWLYEQGVPMSSDLVFRACWFKAPSIMQCAMESMLADRHACQPSQWQHLMRVAVEAGAIF